MLKSIFGLHGVGVLSILGSKLVTLGLVLAVFSAHAAKSGPSCESQSEHGPESIFYSSLEQLKGELNGLRGGQEDFLAHYKKARNYAFQLEMMAKFLMQQQGNKVRFAQIRAVTKDLEDRLGRFNETDELLAKFKEKDITFPNGESAKKHYEAKLETEIIELKQWLKDNGWLRMSGKVSDIEDLLSQMKWVDQKTFREYAIVSMNGYLRELQSDVDAGKFDPADKKTGYTMEEVEDKVHKLRRAIRMVSQVMAYSGGLFVLTDKVRGLGRKAFAAVDFYSPILKNRIATTDFAKLPEAYDKNPILVPRTLFAVNTSHVEVFGTAKDWAQNLDRLLHAGMQGRIDLDHLDINLVNREGTPMPFNALVASILKEIKETQLYANMARAIRDLNE